MRMTGSAGSVTVFSEAFFTTELDSVGQLFFGAEVERSRVSWAETNRAGAERRTKKRSTVEMNFENLFMMKGDKPGERAGKAILLQKPTQATGKFVVSQFELARCLEAGVARRYRT